MPRFDFSPLWEVYPDLIRGMDVQFDSHQFILLLAKRHQARYVEALHAYRDDQPFQTVHGILAKHLHEYRDLIRHEGEHTSHDIFGEIQRCAKWSTVRMP